MALFLLCRARHSRCCRIAVRVISLPKWQFSRRAWLKSAILVGSCAWTGLDRVVAAYRQVPDPLANGEFLGVLPFLKEGKVPLETLLGRNLDARLYTDLSKLSSDTSHVAPVPTEHFYIRTAASALLQPGELTRVNLFGYANVAKPPLTLESLRKRARPMGLCLLECAGNTREASFGMMGVADWSGLPLIEALEPLGKLPSEASILVSGFDRYDSPSVSSQPGASWIFSLDQIRSSGAFLAIEMNGRTLPADHGAPLRLVVPGWYGCTCIKWVNEIRVVDLNAQPTSQMQEFAQRTHQQGSPKLARDYQPATIDSAAMPVRIEKWRVDGKIRYRVIGILWGGTEPARRLEIRFNPEENYVSVDNVHQGKNEPWTFWTHAWTPASTGRYLIRLQIAEPKVRTRRLDMGFYVREVEILDV
jgi:DMSO/TMAO reductase YedYZ molybdopterin-dependent catalytic subunit